MTDYMVPCLDCGKDVAVESNQPEDEVYAICDDCWDKREASARARGERIPDPYYLVVNCKTKEGAGRSLFLQVYAYSKEEAVEDVTAYVKKHAPEEVIASVEEAQGQALLHKDEFKLINGLGD